MLRAFALVLIGTVLPSVIPEARCLVPKTALEAGTVLERNVDAGEVHHYGVGRTASGTLHLTVEQQGADVVLTVSDGQQLTVSVDRPSTRFGTELLSLSAAKVPLRVEVRVKTSGRYRIENGQAAATERLAAELAETAAGRLHHQGSSEAWRSAAAGYADAATLWHDLGETPLQARALYSAGVLYGRLGETGKGLELLERSLPLWQTAQDTHGEADTWNLIGYQSWLRDDPARAVEAYRRALGLRRADGDRCGQAQTLSNVGFLKNRRGRPREALENYLEALELCRHGQDPPLEASMLTNVGGVYEVLGELERALELYGEALPLLDGPGQRRTLAVVLNNMGQASPAPGPLPGGLRPLSPSAGRAASHRRRAPPGHGPQ